MKRVIHHANQWFPFFSIVIIVLLFAVSLYNLFTAVTKNDASLLVNDLAKLETIFKKINDEAIILNIEGKKNNINFLNIKKGGFIGSEVGPLNLAYPDKWDGPYLKQNPVIQQAEYQIIKAKNGYFIIPGDGVALPNGKVIGKDIIIDDTTDIDALMSDENQLRYHNKPLAARLSMSHTLKNSNVVQALLPGQWED